MLLTSELPIERSRWRSWGERAISTSGVIGAVVFKLLHQMLSTFTPQYWTFWIGLFLVLLMLVGREKLFKPWTWGRRA